MAKVLILADKDDVENQLLFELVLKKESHICLSTTMPQEVKTHFQNTNFDLILVVDTLWFDFVEFYQNLKIDTDLCNVPVIIYSSLPFGFGLKKLQPTPEEYGDVVMVRPMDFDDFLPEVKRLTEK